MNAVVDYRSTSSSLCHTRIFTEHADVINLHDHGAERAIIKCDLIIIEMY